MEPTIKEIAALLRSTEDMATQFVQRVQSRVGQSVSHSEILAVMQKIPTKSLSMEKVVVKIQQKQKSASGRESKRATMHRPSRPATPLKRSADTEITASSSAVPRTEPKTILGKLESVLQGNWGRAEADGLKPKRMSPEAFIDAIYQYTDRREGTRRRILQAARQLDQADVVLTPALVADAVHELYQD
jgi:hypothetical protein